MDALSVTEAWEPDKVVVNCSKRMPVPNSRDYLSDLETSYLIAIVVGGVFAVSTLLIYFEQLVYMHSVLLHWKPRSSAVWLLGIYPVYAMTSIIALFMPRTTSLNELVASVFFSVTMYLFCQMMIGHYGGKDKMTIRLAEHQIPLNSPPICCCCTCLPRPEISKSRLLILELMVMQYAILKPLFLYIAVILVTDNGAAYVQGNATMGEFVDRWMSLLGTTSTLIAVYGNVMIFRMSAVPLQKVSIKPKFYCFQLVLILENVQRALLSILEGTNVITCQPPLDKQATTQRYRHLVIVFEMFLLALIARYYYRKGILDTIPPEDKRDIERTSSSTMTTNSLNYGNRYNVEDANRPLERMGEHKTFYGSTENVTSQPTSTGAGSTTDVHGGPGAVALQTRGVGTSDIEVHEEDVRLSLQSSGEAHGGVVQRQPSSTSA